MWGKEVMVADVDQGIRITPTHVGKSMACVAFGSDSWDHPHPCGEKLFYPPDISVRMGSPPPMWGKAAISCAVVSDIGITPTHVGKSCHTFEQPFKDKDHPHPCGEKPYISNIAVDEEGSPPPMWGKGYRIR